MSSQNAMQQTHPIQGPAKPQPSGQTGKLRASREAEDKIDRAGGRGKSKT